MNPALLEIADSVLRHPRLVVLDDYELLLIQNTETVKAFQNGTQTLLRDGCALQISLRILHRKRPGQSTVNQTTSGALETLLDSAFASSLHSDADPWFRFPILKESRNWVQPQTVFDDLQTAIPGFKIPSMQIEETYQNEHTEIHLYRRGEKINPKFIRNIFSATLALKSQGAKHPMVLKEYRAQTVPLAMKSNWLQSMIKRADDLSLGQSVLENAPTQLVFGPQIGAAIASKIVPWFYANSYSNVRSSLCRGQKVPKFSKVLTLVDDGILNGGSSSAPYDLEGCLTQRTNLVKDGSVQGLLFDTYNAVKENRLSTGNFCRTGPGLEPSISHNNTFFEASKLTKSQLLSSVGRGVYLEGLQTFRDSSQRPLGLSLSGCGWEMIMGRRVKPLRDFTIEFNLIDLLGCAVAVADDLEFFGSFGSPTILFEKVPRVEFGKKN